MTAPLVIINPNASRLRDPEQRARVLAAADEAVRRRVGVAPEVSESHDLLDGHRLVEEAAQRGAPFVVAAGGDGTVMEVVSTLVGTGIPVVIVPCGTGNILAGTLGIPRDPVAALKRLPDAVVRAIDLGEASWEADGSAVQRSFAVGAGMGFDAHVMTETSDEDKRRFGQAAYFRTAVRLASTLHPVPCRVTLDDETFETEAALVLAVNCGELIPGFVAPRLRVVPDDGLLDVLIVRGGGLVPALHGAVRLLLSAELATGTPAPTDAAVRMRAASVRVEPLEPQPIQVDGHPFEHAASLTATVRRGEMHILMAPRGRR